MTLTEFLLARIAEDESSSRWGRLHDDPHDPDGLTKILRWDDGRVRTECEAKRRIVERCTPLANLQVRRQTRTLAHDVLLDLASPYADHPDFDPAWRI